MNNDHGTIGLSGGARIRLQRIQRGMSLREAARILGLTHVKMGEVERGVRPLLPEQQTTWDHICAAFCPVVAVDTLDLTSSDQPTLAIEHGPFTLLDISAEPVGGWWPEDEVGGAVLRVEGPLHPRVGTVLVDEVDAESMPRGTIAERPACAVRFGNAFLVRAADYGWVDVRQHGARYEQEVIPELRIIGATILYVPMEASMSGATPQNMIYNAVNSLSKERTVDELHKSISESLERAHNIADNYLTPLAPRTKGTKQ